MEVVASGPVTAMVSYKTPLSSTTSSELGAKYVRNFFFLENSLICNSLQVFCMEQQMEVLG